MIKYSQILKIISFGLLFISITLNSYSQDIDIINYDYSKVDSYVLGLTRKYKDIGKLANDLTKDFDKDFEKVRAIFRWIAENISYDTKLSKVNKPKSFTYRTEQELKDILEQANNKIINDVLRRKKGVCEGYSRLFKTLCHKAEIKTEIVKGYVKNLPQNIGKEINNQSNHTWNAVYLSNKWYLIDVTWASGYTDMKVTKFTKKFRPSYFLISPGKLILDHYPDDNKWQLLNKKISKKQFFNLPLIKIGFLKYDISSFKPGQGVIKSKRNEIIEFEYTTQKDITTIYVHKNNDKYSQESDFTKNKNNYTFGYSFKSKGTYYFTIYLNKEPTIIYKIVVK